MHTYIPLGRPQRNSQQWLTTGAQKWGGWGDGRRSEAEMLNWCPLSPSQCLGMSAMPPVLNLWSLSKVFRFLPPVSNTEVQCYWTVSQSSVIFEFNIKCGTRWQTVCGKAKRSESPGCWTREEQHAGHRLSVLTLLHFLEEEHLCDL